MPVQSTYDPTSSQPYTPVQTPDPAPAKESPFGGQPGYQFKPEPISHGGAIAGMFDGVLRGFVNGYADGQAHKALTLKKKSDDLNNSYNQDAQRLYQLTASGVDPNSEEYKAAKSSVEGSWGALQDFRGGLLEQQQGKKKGKKQDAEKPPQAVLTDPASTPQEKAAALYALSKKAGPPVYGQIAALNTPQAQQQRQLQQDTTKTQADMAHLSSQIADLSSKDNPTPEEITKLGDLTERYRHLRETLNPTKTTATDRKRYTDDGKFTYMVDDEGNEISGTRHPVSVAATKGRPAWGKDSKGYFLVELDPSNANKEMGERNYNLQPPASIAGSIKEGVYHWQDNLGETVASPYTTVSRPVGNPGAGHSQPPAASSGSQAAPSTPPAASGTPSVPPAASAGSATPSAAATAPSATPARRAKPQKAAVPPPASSTSPATPPAPGPKGSKVLGYGKLSGPAAAEVNEYRKKFEAAQSANDAIRRAMRTHLNGGDASLEDKGVALEWLKARMNRVTQQEANAINNLGGLKMAWDGRAAKIVSGELSARQIAMFAKEAAGEYHDTLNNYNEALVRNHLPPITPGKTSAKPQAPPAQASDEVYAADGKTLIGHVVDGQYVPLGKK